MQDTLISFETAKLAKEKGFDWETYDNFMGSGNSYSTHPITNHNDPTFTKKRYSRPTQSLLQKWIRENHFIDIYITGYAYGYYPQLNNVPPANEKIPHKDIRWNTANSLNIDCKTYEQALEIALIEALKLI